MLGRIVALLVVLAAGGATAAQAIVYTATRQVGAYTAYVYLQTNGTLGSLVSSDFTAWGVRVKGPNSDQSMNGGNANFYAKGIIATASELKFDFSAAPASFGLLIYPDNQGSTLEDSFWGFETYNIIENNRIAPGMGGEFAWWRPSNPAGRAYIPQSGVKVIASTSGFSTGSVPEPESWALFITGMGIVGLGLRRRHRAARLAALTGATRDGHAGRRWTAG